MFRIITSLKELNFRMLCCVYSDELLSAGKQEYPMLNENMQVLEAEQDFYQDTSEFFRLKGAFYAVLETEGCYYALLRAEPYQDGYLIAGLQTEALVRNQGYASELLAQTLAYLSGQEICKVYSHIRKDNQPSIRCHIKNGFSPITDYARYLDGSVDNRCSTYLKELCSP